LEKDLVELNSDVFCLQEVEKGIYDKLDDSLRTKFSGKYNSLHISRKIPKFDGIATFWNSEKF